MSGQWLAAGRARGNVPQNHGAVLAPSGHGFAVRAEGHTSDGSCVAAQQRAHKLVGVRIPKRQLAAKGAGGQCPAVGAKRHAGDAAGASLERSPRRNIP